MLWAGHEFAARSRCDLDLQGRDPNLRATRRLNIVVISVKLCLNQTSNNKVMGRTRMGRTDGRTDGLTDGQGDDYMLPRNFSGSIKNETTYK